MRAEFVASEVGNGLRRNLTMTLAVIITVAVSLSLFGVSLLVRAQVDTMKDFWYDKVEVSIFLCAKGSDTPSCAGGAVTSGQRDQIEADLESLRPLVQDIYYESQAEAFVRFQEQFSSSPIADSVNESALPESFRVKLADPTQYDGCRCHWHSRDISSAMAPAWVNSPSSGTKENPGLPDIPELCASIPVR